MKSTKKSKSKSETFIIRGKLGDANEPKPDSYYAEFAKLFRAQGREVEDNDYELIDLVVKDCDRLLNLRSFLT